MDSTSLVNTIRSRAYALADAEELPVTRQELADDAELLRVLAHIVEGIAIDRAFGSPGDWGYNSKIGSALAAKERGAS